MKKRQLSLMLAIIMLILPLANVIAEGVAIDEADTYTYLSSNIDSKLYITEEGIYINDVYYTQEEFVNLLDNAEVTELTPDENGTIAPMSAIAIGAGTYIIAGIGKVIVTEAGKIIVAGVVVKAGSWVYNTVMNWFEVRNIKKSLPSRMVSGNKVVLSYFKNNKGKRPNDNNSGTLPFIYDKNKLWEIQKDRAYPNSHGGSAFKLFYKGVRKATLDINGKILRK